MAIQSAQTLQTLLSSNWNPANTGSRTPAFQRIYADKRIRFNDGDFVLIDAMNETKNPELGGTRSTTNHDVKIDVRTKVSEAQLELMKIEVDRIILANRTNPDANFHVVNEFTFPWQYLNNGMINLFRAIKTVTLMDLNA